MKPRLIIGLMSGTSVDAIDAALVQITGRHGNYRAQVLHHIEHNWPAKLRQRLLAIMAPAATTTQELCDLNALIAHEFANAAIKCITSAKIDRKNITALGSHGQTICHLPNSAMGNRKSAIPSTLQLGDPSILATLTRIPTVGNFRPADMTVGGQGAPLVPWTDAILLSHKSKTRCLQNIGGIANVTYLPSGQLSGVSGQKKKPADHWPLTTDHSSVLAFDTGPGNMLLDAAISLATNGTQKFDKNGRLAAKGTVDMKLFRQLQSHPYFDRKPPKSTGREDFGISFAKKLTTDHWPLTTLLSTLTRLTAWSIADAYLHFLPQLPDEVILCGGGADNPTLVQMLTEEFSRITSNQTGPQKISIDRIDNYGIPNKAKEAASFALLAAATLDHIPANLPSVTGAARPVILGVIANPLI
jgi:anhydro-N-acetylmuramic acid kinase